jgi:hypothetical protein
VTQQRDECLGVLINSQPRSIERNLISSHQIIARRQLDQRRRVDRDRKAGITALKRVANAIRFVFVEKDDLIGLRHGLDATHMMDVDPPIRKYEVCRANGLLSAQLLAPARTYDVPYGRRVGHEKMAGIEVGDVEEVPVPDR